MDAIMDAITVVERIAEAGKIAEETNRLAEEAEHIAAKDVLSSFDMARLAAIEETVATYRIRMQAIWLRLATIEETVATYRIRMQAINEAVSPELDRLSAERAKRPTRRSWLARLLRR